MDQVREAAVAGLFYPGSPADLRESVQALMAGTGMPDARPKVLVAPHAGYIYSGPVAATAYRQLNDSAAPVHRVVLLGPSHRVAFDGIACSSACWYRTPLGLVPVDGDAVATLQGLPGVTSLDAAHRDEHSLEVHLPFLQCCLERFSLVPLVVGRASPEQVSQVLEQLWGGPETLLVVSTDLSHFHAYEEAVALDTATADRIESLQQDLSGEEACGCHPLNGLLRVLRQRNLAIERLAMNNSGDTAGDRSRVVGYGAWMVRENA